LTDGKKALIIIAFGVAEKKKLLLKKVLIRVAE